jgi:hypothetical protein
MRTVAFSIFLLLWLLPTGVNRAQDLQVDSVIYLLNDKAEKIRHHEGRFLDFNTAMNEVDREYVIVSQIGIIARSAHAHVDAAKALLEIFKNVSSKQDKENIEQRVTQAIRALGIETVWLAGYVKVYIPFIKSQGIADAASQLKEDLVGLAAILENTRLN